MTDTPAMIEALWLFTLLLTGGAVYSWIEYDKLYHLRFAALQVALTVMATLALVYDVLPVVMIAYALMAVNIWSYRPSAK